MIIWIICSAVNIEGVFQNQDNIDIAILSSILIRIIISIVKIAKICDLKLLNISNNIRVFSILVLLRQIYDIMIFTITVMFQTAVILEIFNITHHNIYVYISGYLLPGNQIARLIILY